MGFVEAALLSTISCVQQGQLQGIFWRCVWQSLGDQGLARLRHGKMVIEWGFRGRTHILEQLQMDIHDIHQKNMLVLYISKQVSLQTPMVF